MKFPVIAIILMLMLPSDAFSSSRPALSGMAHDRACELADSIAHNNSEFGEKFYEMADLFPLAQRKALKVQIDGQLKPRKFVDVDVYLIGDLNGLLAEYFLVAQSAAHGNLYVRLRFEMVGDKSQLYDFQYQDNIEKIHVETFLQKPVLKPCS